MNNVATIKTDIKEIQQVLHCVGIDATHPAHDRRHPLYEPSISAINRLQGKLTNLQSRLALESVFK